MKVILVMAATADGKIARHSDELVDWSGSADKQYFVSVTKQAGYMIMGSKTYDTIGKVLPERKSIVMTRDQTRVSDHEDLVFTDQPPVDILEDLKEQGAQTVCLVGGAKINTLFMAEGLIDEVHLTVVPVLFGKGLSLFDTVLDSKMELLENRILDKNSLLLKYRVNREI